MSLDNTRPDESAAPVETAPAEEPGQGRRISMWFLVVPIVLTIIAAALAFFLLSPREEDLMTTTDDTAVAVAVANAQPARPAFTPPPSTAPAETPPAQ